MITFLILKITTLHFRKKFCFCNQEVCVTWNIIDYILYSPLYTCQT